MPTTRLYVNVCNTELPDPLYCPRALYLCDYVVGVYHRIIPYSFGLFSSRDCAGIVCGRVPQELNCRHSVSIHSYVHMIVCLFVVFAAAARSSATQGDRRCRRG